MHQSVLKVIELYSYNDNCCYAGVEMLKKTIFLFLFVSITGCSDSNTAGSKLTELNSFDVNENDLVNLLTTKGLENKEGKRQERLKENYIERNEIASIIVNEQKINLSSVVPEIKRNRNEIIIKHYFDQYLANISSDESIKKYYDENIEEFTDKKAHVAHILVDVKENASIEEKALANKKAIQIADELRRGGDFIAAAKKYSDDDDTKKSGGDLNWIKEGDVEQLIFDKVVSLEVGDISEPVLTSRGYHILKLMEPVDKKVASIEAVREKIAYKLKYNAKLNELKRLKQLANQN